MKVQHVLASAVVVPAIALALGGATACGDDVCEKAEDIVKECPAPANGPVLTTSWETTKAECSGSHEAVSRCIVDNKDAYCAFVKNPRGADPNNAYSACASAAQ